LEGKPKLCEIAKERILPNAPVWAKSLLRGNVRFWRKADLRRSAHVSSVPETDINGFASTRDRYSNWRSANVYVIRPFGSPLPLQSLHFSTFATR
jgi:hypothetical protein